MASWPRTIVPFEVTSLEMPGPLISKSQSGRVNLRTTQQIGRTWTERYLVNVRSVNGRALLAFVDDVWRNGTTFTIDHRDHLTPMGTGGGSPLINQPAQLVTDPENFGNWTPAGTIGRTSGQSDPYGTTAAYLLDSNTPSGGDGIVQNVAFTGNAEKSVRVHMRAGTANFSQINLRDVTAGADRHRVTVTWTAGVPTLGTAAGAGTRYSIDSPSSGWYSLAFSATGVLAANTNRIEIYPDPTGGGLTVYAFGANAWNNAAPGGYIGPSHLTATGGRIYLDGATASVSNWLRAGDIVGVGGLGPVYELPSNVNSEANGYVSVPVNPPIFTGAAPADNALVTITGVTLTGCILEPPTYPTTSSLSADYGELVCKFSESL